MSGWRRALGASKPRPSAKGAHPYRKRSCLEALRLTTTKLTQRGTGYPSWGHPTQLRISRGSAGLIYKFFLCFLFLAVVLVYQIHWNILIIKSPRCSNFSNLFFGKNLYMFRTVPLPIISSFSLYTQQWYMSYRFADSLRAGSELISQIYFGIKIFEQFLQ